MALTNSKASSAAVTNYFASSNECSFISVKSVFTTVPDHISTFLRDFTGVLIIYPWMSARKSLALGRSDISISLTTPFCDMHAMNWPSACESFRCHSSRFLAACFFSPFFSVTMEWAYSSGFSWPITLVPLSTRHISSVNSTFSSALHKRDTEEKLCVISGAWRTWWNRTVPLPMVIVTSD